MKKIIMIGLAALATVLVSEVDAASLAEARGKIAEAVKDSSTMTSLVKDLSAEDQVSFLSDVNQAIAKMGGSVEEKTALFLDANTAAMKGAQKGNMNALLAETMATASPEALTVINERFASDLFNRDADPTKRYSDAEFTKIATDTMAKIQERNAGNDAEGVRDTFGILMFLRASNGTPEDLCDKLVANLPDEETRDLAKNEWIPAAMGWEQEKSYEPMLGAIGAGEAPRPNIVLREANAESISAFLDDLATGSDEITKATSGYEEVRRIGEDNGIDRIPRTFERGLHWYPGHKGDKRDHPGEMDPTPPGHPERPEPHPYRGQRIWAW